MFLHPICRLSCKSFIYECRTHTVYVCRIAKHLQLVGFFSERGGCFLSGVDGPEWLPLNHTCCVLACVCEYGCGLGATGLNLPVRQHKLVLPSVLGLFGVGGDIYNQDVDD